MRNFSAIFLAFFALILAGCANTTPQHDYSAFLQHQPRSLLVLMPTNETTEIKASAAVISHSLAPLAEAGYYVFPMALVNDTFKHNGINEPAEIAQVPLNKLKQYFDADAVLYMNVTQYGTSYQLLNSKTSVAISAKLVDLATGATLWERSATAQKDSSGGGSDLLGALISAVVSQIIDTTTDAGYDMSRVATAMLFAPDCYDCLLRGPRSPKHKQDRQLNSGK